MKFELKGRPTPGMVLWALSALVLAGALSFQLYLRNETKNVRRDTAAKRAEITRARGSGLSLLSPAELARLQQRVTAFKRGFISVSETASILDGISDQAERSGVRVVGVDSEEPVVLKGEGDADFEMNGVKYSRVPIRIRVEGSSRAVADFLRAMARSSERIFVVDTLEIARPTEKDKQGSVTGDVRISFFSNTL